MTPDHNSAETTADCEQVKLGSNPEVEKGFITGAVIPQDLTVKFVRADSALWEILLASASSLFLTLFGVFLGAWMSSAPAVPASQGVPAVAAAFGIYERIACFSFGGFAIIALGIWGVLKWKQCRAGVTVPIEAFSDKEG